MEQNTISLAKFISKYLGVEGSGIKKLSHEDAKHLFPNLKRSSFSFVEKHPFELESGNVILVTDGKKIIPYFTPNLIRKETDEELVIELDKKKENNIVNDYANMKIYELKKLLNVKFNGRSISRQARRELEDRGVILNKKYNRQEFKKWKSEYERN